MDTDTQNLIKSRFQELPPEVQKAITSSDLSDKFDKISKKYSLRIDQSGNLQTETLLVMLGLEKPADYIDNLVKNAELSRDAAIRIGADVNMDILGSIRNTLEKITSDDESNDEKTQNQPTDNTDLQKAGGISVDKNQASADIVAVGKDNAQMSPQLSKAVTLDAIENPPAFIDRLLTGPTTSVNETVVKQGPSPATPTSTQPKPAASAAPTKPSGPRIDPYREPIE